MREIGDARLHHGDAVVEVDLEDAVELGHAEQHAVGERQRAARQRGAGAARHDLDAFARGNSARTRLTCSVVSGSTTTMRQLPIGGQPVASRRGASPFGRRSRPRPARSRDSAATMRSRRASTASSGGGMATDTFAPRARRHWPSRSGPCSLRRLYSVKPARKRARVAKNARRTAARNESAV